MARFDLKESDYAFNASLDPFNVLKRMGFTDQSIFREGNIVRIHCPIHKDLVRKSMIIDASERTFKCQYSQCEAYQGGLLIELVAMYYDCPLEDVTKNLFGDDDKSNDLLFRGEMYINKGQHQEALPFLEQAVQLDPRNEITRAKLAALLLELGRKDDAYREYMQAAESYAVRGELEKTLSIYNILIILQPGAVKARKELAFLFARMGRPDAAAEQLKWVVDYYVQHGQVRGAMEAINSIIELGGDSGMNQFLLGQIHAQTGSMPQAVAAFEKSVTMLIEAREPGRARMAIDEALRLAPANPKLRELRESVKELEDGSEPASDGSAADALATENFMDWLKDVDAELAAGIPGVGTAPKGKTTPASSDRVPVARAAESKAKEAAPKRDTTIPARKEAAPKTLTPAAAAETSEISPEDRRVALCLNDMKDLNAQQLEAMRQQLIGMFTDVRKTYEEGLLSDWEMRTIKDFYKAFCMAVEEHRRQVS